MNTNKFIQDSVYLLIERLTINISTILNAKINTFLEFIEHLLQLFFHYKTNEIHCRSRSLLNKYCPQRKNIRWIFLSFTEEKL